jgi:hypothetical protein
MAQAHEWLGRSLLMNGKVSEAQLHFEESLQIRESLLGPQHSDTA